MKKARKKLVIIDSNSVIHRAYHALPRLTTKKGELVNAVYGFLLVFFKAVREFQPDFIVSAFDFPAPTFRHKKYNLYKAKREKAPQDLYDQIPKVKEILRDFGVPVFEKEGFEADDVVATVADRFSDKKASSEIDVIILSGDSDSLQLIDENTKVYALRKGIRDTVLYGKDAVKEKYGGLTPEQLLDYKSLRGDPSDNIPGVKGVGEKTAIGLLLRFENLEKLYKTIENGKPETQDLKPKLKEILLKYRDQAFLSKFLARPEKNVPIDFNLEKAKWGNYDKEKIITVLSGFGFRSLIDRVFNQESGGKKKEIPFQGGQQKML